MSRTVSKRRLQPILDDLYKSYIDDFKQSPSGFFSRRKDPLHFAHVYSQFPDVEAAAFLASTFAYGNVSSLCSFVEKLLSMLRPSPYEFLQNGPEAVESLRSLRPYYRLHKTPEILGFLSMMATVYQKHNSLYALFLKSYDNYSTMAVSLSRFVKTLYEIHGSPLPFLLPSPESGSPCKRLNLFLRWMVRRDGLDLGIWKDVSPANLIVPLDTHIGRIAYRLGWMETPSLSWKKAETVTRVLRGFNAEDPIRYDFSLCHESIGRSPRLQKLLNRRRKAD